MRDDKLEPPTSEGIALLHALGWPQDRVREKWGLSPRSYADHMDGASSADRSLIKYASHLGYLHQMVVYYLSLLDKEGVATGSEDKKRWRDAAARRLVDIRVEIEALRNTASDMADKPVIPDAPVTKLQDCPALDAD